MENRFKKTITEIKRQTGIQKIKDLQALLLTKEISIKQVMGYDYEDGNPITINKHVNSYRITDSLLEYINPLRRATFYEEIEIIIYPNMLPNLSKVEVAKSIINQLLYGSN